MLADVTYDVLTVLSPVLAIVVGAVGAEMWGRFRKGGEDRKALQAIKDTLYGRKRSLFEQHPPPGLEDRVAVLESQFQTVISKITPNGGNTREIGDIVLLIAKKLDIPIPDHAEESDA